MTNRTILITGATGGIGKEIAIGLAKRGVHVIITGRNLQRGEQAVKDIEQASGNSNIDLVLADMAVQADIRRLAETVIEQYSRLDVLINNVGVLAEERTLTEDGIELNFAINHLATFLLTQLLLPLLKQSAPARVINVTGGMPSTIDLENLQAEKSYMGMIAYSHSKAILMAASYEMAQHLEGTGVTVNVAYPGAAATDMTRNMSAKMMPFWMRPMMPVMRLFLRGGAERAARSSIYLASSAEVEGVTGTYFDANSKPAKWSDDMVDEGVRLHIWQISQALVSIH